MTPAPRCDSFGAMQVPGRHQAVSRGRRDSAAHRERRCRGDGGAMAEFFAAGGRHGSLCASRARCSSCCCYVRSVASLFLDTLQTQRPVKVCSWGKVYNHLKSADHASAGKVEVENRWSMFAGGARPLREKPLPGLLDVFGWCTWDAFYSRVSARGEAVSYSARRWHPSGTSPSFQCMRHAFSTDHHPSRSDIIVRPCTAAFLSGTLFAGCMPT